MTNTKTALMLAGAIALGAALAGCDASSYGHHAPGPQVFIIPAPLQPASTRPGPWRNVPVPPARPLQPGSVKAPAVKVGK